MECADYDVCSNCLDKVFHSFSICFVLFYIIAIFYLILIYY